MTTTNPSLHKVVLVFSSKYLNFYIIDKYQCCHSKRSEESILQVAHGFLALLKMTAYLIAVYLFLSSSLGTF